MTALPDEDEALNIAQVFEISSAILGKLAAIEKLLAEKGGVVAFSYNSKLGWTAALEWGKEAEDSDMVGAAAYSVASSGIPEAIFKLTEDAKL